MKKQIFSLKKVSLFIFSALILVSCSKKEDAVPTSNTIIEDQFKTDASGWKIVGDAQGGYVEASYSPEGGVIHGYIYAKDDVTGGIWYFAAPSSYKGDKSEFYGSKLNYSIFQESNRSNQFDAEDIIFKSGSKQIYFIIDQFPNETWTNYSVSIDESSNWYTGTFKGTHAKASKAEIKEVLSNVTDFWIRGEFESGPDLGGLDNVQIKRK